MSIEQDLKEFENIWQTYYQLLPINDYEFDIYIKIINDIRTNSIDLVKNKFCFMELLEFMSLAIWNYKENDNDEEEYHKDRVYDDKELSCCYRIKTYLKTEV
jgi:hypothetical protein